LKCTQASAFLTTACDSRRRALSQEQIEKKVGTRHGLPWQKISRDRLAEVIPTEDDKFFREHLE
jgi:hypothetical protein